jgi:hypothetical protein
MEILRACAGLGANIDAAAPIAPAMTSALLDTCIARSSIVTEFARRTLTQGAAAYDQLLITQGHTQ